MHAKRKQSLSITRVTKVYINGKEYEIVAGMASAQKIYELVGCNFGALNLVRPGDVDVPVSSSDYIIIDGGETFEIREGQLENNPQLQKPVQLRFNGVPGKVLPTAKITGRELKNLDEEFPRGRLFANIRNGPDAEVGDEMTVLVQDDNMFFVIPAEDGVQEGDPVDIEECSKHGRHPPKGQSYRIRVDREKHVVKHGEITGASILALVDKTSADWSLNWKLSDGKRERIKAEETVDVSCPGIERFETVRRQAQQGHECCT